MMRTFEEFKSENDERLKAVEQRKPTSSRRKSSRGSTPRSTPSSSSSTTLSLKGARPALGADARVAATRARASTSPRSTPTCAPARARACAQLELKAMSVGSNPDGGYLVPVEIETEIGQRLANISPIRGDRRRAHDLRHRLQEAVHDRGPGGRLGRRDRRAHPDRVADARRAVVPGDGALRHAGGDRDAAGGRRRQPRPVARRRSRPGLRRAGRHRLRHRRRHQQAEGLSRLHHGRQRRRGPGATSATSPPARPAPSRRRTRPTCWST